MSVWWKGIIVQRCYDGECGIVVKICVCGTVRTRPHSFIHSFMHLFIPASLFGLSRSFISGWRPEVGRWKPHRCIIRAVCSTFLPCLTKLRSCKRVTPDHHSVPPLGEETETLARAKCRKQKGEKNPNTRTKTVMVSVALHLNGST